ncbi:hypothetical protein KUDE01_019642 [Dissostichus eleginoides]|uniref:Uncharacterized protein n=1 Tax=Dissostichus eleginoides TaxID=100907 RepID=A0AAD9F605_DISEL|nr:hypothetical protein KUDE01_019642 [Dissostichus eleginoides]
MYSWTPSSGIGMTLIVVKSSSNIVAAIENATQADDELTAHGVKGKIQADFGVSLGLTTIRRARRKLGWKYGRTRFTPMIRDHNKEAG